MTLTKTLGYAIAVTALVAFTGSAAWAQTSDSATASSSAFVVKPITIEKLNDLLFGSFEAGTGGTGTNPEDGLVAPTTTSGVTFVPGTGNIQTRARFKVTGKNGLKFDITGDTEVTLNGPGGSTMTATLLKLTSFTFPGSGETFVFVGGILTVVGGQTPGFYESDVPFNVIVTYQ